MLRQKEKELVEKLFENFQGLLRSRLNEPGTTQEDIAKLLGCRQSEISRWLADKRRPSLSNLLGAYKKLGGGEMAEILREILGERDAAIILTVGDDDPEYFQALLEMLSQRDEFYDKLKMDTINYAKWRRK